MRIRFTEPAALELDQVLTFIEGHSPIGAHRVKRRLQNVLSLLSRYPSAGQRTRRPGMRRFVVSPYPYLVFYRIGGDEIVIHSIRHGARKQRL